MKVKKEKMVSQWEGILKIGHSLQLHKNIETTNVQSRRSDHKIKEITGIRKYST